MIVDSSKTGIRLKYLLRNSALDVRVLRLVRDGRAVALTYMDPHRYADAIRSCPARRGTGRARHRGVPLVPAARQWRRSQEEAAALLRSIDPARWITVRYEDLCADPDAHPPAHLRVHRRHAKVGAIRAGASRAPRHWQRHAPRPTRQSQAGRALALGPVGD